jgi:hypothetical protein
MLNSLSTERDKRLVLPLFILDMSVLGEVALESLLLNI